MDHSAEPRSRRPGGARPAGVNLGPPVPPRKSPPVLEMWLGSSVLESRVSEAVSECLPLWMSAAAEMSQGVPRAPRGSGMESRVACLASLTLSRTGVRMTFSWSPNSMRPLAAPGDIVFTELMEPCVPVRDRVVGGRYASTFAIYDKYGDAQCAFSTGSKATQGDER